MKWRSKATGAIFDTYDYLSVNEHYIALFLEGESWDTGKRPLTRLKYSELIEAFEKVQK